MRRHISAAVLAAGSVHAFMRRRPYPAVDTRPTTVKLARLTHHCHFVETDNDSIRFSRSTAEAKQRIKRVQPAPPTRGFGIPVTHQF